MKIRIHLLLSLGLLACAHAAAAEETGAFGYFRALDGSATLVQVDSGERFDAEVNQPILGGDSLWVAPQGRVEVVLADGSRVRADCQTEILFQELSARGDQPTVLQLRQGNMQWVVPKDPDPEAALRLDTANATIYLHAAGSYRISTGNEGWTQLVVREGYAEVLTPTGSSVVRAGEQVRVDGFEQAKIRISTAPDHDSLEQWAQRQEGLLARSESARYVDGNLAYSSAVLDNHGTWIHVEGRPAWRPYVSVGWRPYWHGRWSHGRHGMAWVSYEPWGWVPYHYGDWDYFSGHGWVWFPGSVYSPAWVHWYWGPGYAGWVPSGFYGHYYGGRLRHGVYGWAGGRWDYYHRWTFCSTRYLGVRTQYAHLRPGYSLRNDLGGREIPRGIITTDTRGVRPGGWHRPDDVLSDLRRGQEPSLRSLPDVTDFVGRKRELPKQVDDRVRARDDGRRLAISEPGRRVTGQPSLQPQPRTIEETAPTRTSYSDWRTGDRSKGRDKVSLGSQPAPRPKEPTPTGRYSEQGPTRSNPDWRVGDRRTPASVPDQDRSGKSDEVRARSSYPDVRSDVPSRSTPDRNSWQKPNEADNRGGSSDWRTGDRTQPSLRATPGDASRSIGGTDRYTERRSYGSVDRGSSPSTEVPVVRRVYDSIRSGTANGTDSYPSAPDRGSSPSYSDRGSTSRYSTPTENRSYSYRSEGRSGTAYRPSSGSETRTGGSSSTVSDNRGSRSSSSSGSYRSRSGSSSISSRSSASSRSSSSSRGSSKRKKGGGGG